jgi:tubulin polyglutamylase TTLL6/13
MKNYQRVNHLPECFELAKKNLLAKNLSKFQSLFPLDYDFFPKTWILPTDSKQFKEQFN